MKGKNKMKKNNKMVVDAVVKALAEGDAYEGASQDIKFVRSFVKDIDFSKTSIKCFVWKDMESCAWGDDEDCEVHMLGCGNFGKFLDLFKGLIVDCDGWNKCEDEVEMSFIRF